VEYGSIEFDFAFDFDDGSKPAENGGFCTKDELGLGRERLVELLVWISCAAQLWGSLQMMVLSMRLVKVA
jgi:hypothetical protein